MYSTINMYNIESRSLFQNKRKTILVNLVDSILLTVCILIFIVTKREFSTWFFALVCIRVFASERVHWLILMQIVFFSL